MASPWWSPVTRRAPPSPVFWWTDWWSTANKRQLNLVILLWRLELGCPDLLVPEKVPSQVGENEKVRRECSHYYLQKSSVRSWLSPGTGWRSWPWTRVAAPLEAASWVTRRGCLSWPGTSGHSSGPAPAGDTWGASQGGTDTASVWHEADVLLLVKDH